MYTRKYFIFLCILTMGSLFLNFFLFITYMGDIWSRVYKSELFSLQDSDSIIINSVVGKSIKLVDEDITVYQEKKGLIDDVLFYFSGQENIVPDYFFPKSYLFAGLSDYAKATNDDALWTFLLNQSSKMIDEDGNLLYEYTCVDQTPIGLFFINAYLYSHDKKFRNAIDNIYRKLINMQDGGIVLYRQGSTIQLVDVLGMIDPFLIEYYRLTGNSYAYNLALKTFVEYQAHGVDCTTGIPVHGYHLYTNVKIGSANWGRGIGWYLMAYSYLPEIQDCLIENYLQTVDEYFQFPYSLGHFDSSVALMFEYCKSKRMEKTRDISFIKPFIQKDGLITSMSGDTHGLNDYSHSFSSSEFVNGLFLMYISL